MTLDPDQQAVLFLAAADAHKDAEMGNTDAYAERIRKPLMACHLGTYGRAYTAAKAAVQQGAGIAKAQRAAEDVLVAAAGTA